MCRWARDPPAVSGRPRVPRRGSRPRGLGLQSTVVGLVFTSVGFGARTADTEGKPGGLGGKRADLATKVEGLAIEETEVRIDLWGDILFDFDKATLRPEATPVLERVAETIREAHARIDGHTTPGAGTATTWCCLSGAPIP